MPAGWAASGSAPATRHSGLVGPDGVGHADGPPQQVGPAQPRRAGGEARRRTSTYQRRPWASRARSAKSVPAGEREPLVHVDEPGVDQRLEGQDAGRLAAGEGRGVVTRGLERDPLGVDPGVGRLDVGGVGVVADVVPPGADARRPPSSPSP